MEVVNVVEVVAETSVVFEVVFVLVSLIVLPSFVKKQPTLLKVLYDFIRYTYLYKCR